MINLASSLLTGLTNWWIELTSSKVFAPSISFTTLVVLTITAYIAWYYTRYTYGL